MVIRAGTGFFYNRFNENSTLTANRFNGVNVIQTFITEEARRLTPRTVEQQHEPNVAGIYSILNQWSPTRVPSLATVPLTQQTIEQSDPKIQSPNVWIADML